jgi:hypothetical protein
MPRQLAFRSAIATMRRESRPAEASLVAAGRFDRRAIMMKAVRIARSINTTSGSWSWRMAIGLRAAWGQAKAAMRAACVAEPFAIRPPSRPVSTRRPASTATCSTG